ncbi:hypothetical protein JXO52_11285 [bacterium]|nr:hypothetical protein [bacterium]
MPNQIPFYQTLNDIYTLLIRHDTGTVILERICRIFSESLFFSRVWVTDPEGAVIVYPPQSEGSAILPEPSFTLDIACGNRSFGSISFLLTNEPLDAGRYRLLHDLAETIGHTLSRLENEKTLDRLQKELPENRHQLNERIKELKCLYAISRLIEKQGISLSEIFQGVLQFIPPAWQYPEIACARIRLGDKTYATENFADSPWKLTREFYGTAESAGILEVCYREQPPTGRRPFLEEEEALIDTIAERLGKAAEAMEMRSALIDQETSFRDLVENSLVGITIIQNGALVYQNSEQKRISAPLPLALITKQWDIIHPDDKEETADTVDALISGREKRIDLNFRFHHLAGNNEPAEIKWVYCRISTADYKGQDALLVYTMDVTHSRHLENMLRVKDKMVSLGHVTAGIAHEIRNPLSGINIYLNALDKICREQRGQEKIPGIIAQMQSASGKIESVIRRVMDFSRPKEPKRVGIDINQPVREAIDLSSVTLRKIGITLRTSLQEGLPECFADPILLEQVILNLITNAAEAMKDSSREKEIEISSGLGENGFSITVADSGPGIPSALKNKIFDPFYSTKSGNTGIGLSLGHRIITDHGGSLDIAASPLGGAAFIITIPLRGEYRD